MKIHILHRVFARKSALYLIKVQIFDVIYCMMLRKYEQRESNTDGIETGGVA